LLTLTCFSCASIEGTIRHSSNLDNFQNTFDKRLTEKGFDRGLVQITFSHSPSGFCDLL
jgi:hypothetical protein